MAKVIFDNGIAYEGTPEEIVDIVVGIAEHQDRREKEEALKLYDYVKVLVSKRGKDGGIVQIVDYLSDGHYGVIEIIDGKRYRVAPENVIKATEEEVADARAKRDAEFEAQRILEDKWASIKREPYEFKTGDAIRYKKAFTTVVKINGDGTVKINQSNHKGPQVSVDAKELTLVFPVEARFDR